MFRGVTEEVTLLPPKNQTPPPDSHFPASSLPASSPPPFATLGKNSSILCLLLLKNDVSAGVVYLLLYLPLPQSACLESFVLKHLGVRTLCGYSLARCAKNGVGFIEYFFAVLSVA